MNISELIERLQEIQAREGNILVEVDNEAGAGVPVLDVEFHARVVGPTNKGRFAVYRDLRLLLSSDA